MNQTKSDIIIVGYGPVSGVLALCLARQGLKVSIFERWTQRYHLPRAICIDHEMLRMLFCLGLQDQLSKIIEPSGLYRWVNADWKELITIDWEQESISGGSETNSVHQPTFEKILEIELKKYSNVEIYLGYEVLEINSEEHSASILTQHIESKEMKYHSAQYVIGADGANSTVRKFITTDIQDKGFDADWLVIDFLPKKVDSSETLKDAIQYCNPARPTTIAPAGIYQGQYLRRWEFMRLPHETIKELENEDKVWQLLSDWVTPEDGELVRFKVYKFRSLIAQSWYRNRVLIAGDAAHVMPPFMGQGMCAGLRDAWNLSWKISNVIKGIYSAEILETYVQERRPHVNDVIEASMYLGKIICISDLQEAKKRDEMFFSKQFSPLPAFPSLVQGFLAKNQNNPLVGMLSPHTQILENQELKRLDDVIQQQFCLVTKQPLPDGINLQIHTDIPLIHLNFASDKLQDASQRLIHFMDQHNIEAMIIRPDFYIYDVVEEIKDVEKMLLKFSENFSKYLSNKIENIAS